jgi:hypothetical protein
MALKSISSYEAFNVGDVVVFSSYGEQYGVKLLRSVYVAETDTYHFIAAEVTIKDNKAVYTKSGDALNLTAHTTAGLRKYSSKWTPDVQFKSGDVLEDQDGVLYLFLSNMRVWNLSRGTQTSLDRWQSSAASYGGRKFKAKKTAGGTNFSKFVKAEDLM